MIYRGRDRVVLIGDVVKVRTKPGSLLKSQIPTRKGSKVIKRYDKAKTPYHRILEFNNMDKRIKQNLKNLYNSLNPVSLKREFVHLQNKLYDMAMAKPFYHRKEVFKNETAYK